MSVEELPPGFYIDDACIQAEGVESYQACHDDGWCGPMRDTYSDAVNDANTENVRRAT